MNDLIIAAFILTVPPTVVSLANYQQGRQYKKTLDEIHVLTNSNLSRSNADLALANNRIAKLEELIMRDADHEAIPPDLRNEKKD